MGAVRPDIFLTPREFFSAGIFTRVTLVFLTGVEILILLPGEGSSPPKVDKFLDDFCT